IGFFRGQFKDNRLDNLTIPRTYFGRSELNNISFKNTDLNESRMCWNDWAECDFSESSLKCCDLRNSIFKDCSFKNANLEDADLRHATFENCDFSGASMKGTKIKKASGILTRFSPKTIKTDKKQNLEIDWQKENGPEAPGG
ncbi:MAG: pentapeptide repeat-containing protein, partial [bacterium]|nr:pentapeptide repeat-containing protein [bacterium]